MQDVNLALGKDLSRCIYLSRENEGHYNGNKKGKKPGGGHTKPRLTGKKIWTGKVTGKDLEKTGGRNI